MEQKKPREIEINGFQCQFCGNSLRSTSGLRRHVREMHQNIKRPRGTPSKCNLCGKICSHLRNHMLQSHEKKNIYKCDKCEKTYTKKRDLKSHILIVHEKENPFCCDLCKKGFANAASLKLHVKRVHTGTQDEPENTYECKKCDKIFKSKRGLN